MNQPLEAVAIVGSASFSIIQQHLGSTNRHRGLGYLRPPVFDSDTLVNRSGPRRHEQGFKTLYPLDL